MSVVLMDPPRVAQVAGLRRWRVTWTVYNPEVGELQTRYRAFYTQKGATRWFKSVALPATLGWMTPREAAA